MKSARAKKLTFAQSSYFVGGPIGVELLGSGLTQSFDFGTPPDAQGHGEAGDNVFLSPEQNVGLKLGGSNNTVQAFGNVWMFDAQGADQFGHYPVGTVFSARKDEPADGRNIQIHEKHRRRRIERPALKLLRPRRAILPSWS